ncbi:hypothetical protein [Rothia nasisuis]|uniref:hypothetical protein n=1 Tax=Rothia nasisuis TaxID=2109647 RepID=UPI001F24CE84|nr:hypothetical protein [Rothia nasisuis]
MTTITREEFVARRKEAERRAILIGEKQRKGQYKPSSSQAQHTQAGSLSRFIAGFKSAIRSK